MPMASGGGAMCWRVRGLLAGGTARGALLQPGAAALLPGQLRLQPLQGRPPAELRGQRLH
jgi:hypothetical protein